MKEPNRFFKFINSFKYAACGIYHSVINERNMRFHIVAAIYVLLLSLFYDFNVPEYSVLVLTIGIVIAMELVNTAIEAFCNLNTTEKNIYVKTAKDTAAGAVLVTAIASVVVGIFLFWDISVFKKVASFFSDNIIFLILFFVSIVASVIFIFYGLPCKKNKFKGVR